MYSFIPQISGLEFILRDKLFLEVKRLPSDVFLDEYYHFVL